MSVRKYHEWKKGGKNDVQLEEEQGELPVYLSSS